MFRYIASYIYGDENKEIKDEEWVLVDQNDFDQKQKNISVVGKEIIQKTTKNQNKNKQIDVENDDQENDKLNQCGKKSQNQKKSVNKTTQTCEIISPTVIRSLGPSRPLLTQNQTFVKNWPIVGYNNRFVSFQNEKKNNKKTCKRSEKQMSKVKACVNNNRKQHFQRKQIKQTKHC